MSLPRRVTEDDLHKILSYFNKKPLGATIAESKSVIDPTLLDSRKIPSYISLGVLKKESDKLKLDEIGKKICKLKKEEKYYGFRDIIKRLPIYQNTVEWIFHNSYEQITANDVGAHWGDHFKAEIGSINEATLQELVTTFFYICQASKFGIFYIGRKGQNSRLEADLSEVERWVESNAIEDTEGSNSTGSSEGDDLRMESEEDGDSDDNSESSNDEFDHTELLPTKVFISHGKNLDIVDQIKTILDINDLNYEIAIEEETTAIPVPDKVFNAMRNCNSAVICVTADQTDKNDDGSYRVNQNVLIEIGAAFVLYEKRVILVWDKSVKIPSNLQGLYRCEISGEELSWSAGMKLLKALKEFKKQSST